MKTFFCVFGAVTMFFGWWLLVGATAALAVDPQNVAALKNMYLGVSITLGGYMLAALTHEKEK